MYKCLDCGRILDDGELKTERSYVSDYMGGCYESFSCCPCGGDIEEVEGVRLFAERLKARIDKEVEDCLNYNAEHNVMGTDAIIAAQSTFATVKYYIAELLGEIPEDN